MHWFINGATASSLEGTLYAESPELIVKCMQTTRILDTKHVGYIQVGSSVHL